MKYLSETGKGFFWGFGFVAIVLAMATFYVLYMQAIVVENYRAQLMSIFKQNSLDNMDVLKPEISSYKVANGKIHIFTKAKNVNARGYGLYLRFSLSDSKDPEDVSICTQPLVFEYGNPSSEYVHYETVCKSTFFSANRINRITVKVASDVNKA